MRVVGKNRMSAVEATDLSTTSDIEFHLILFTFDVSRLLLTVPQMMHREISKKD